MTLFSRAASCVVVLLTWRNSPCIGTCRAFGKLSTTIAAIALGLIVTLAGFAASTAESGNEARPAQDDKLQSEFLLDLTLDAQTPQNLGSAGGGRLIVPVSGGTFAGPRLKGTIIPPGGDWIVQRPDGSRILDVRILLQTDDGQKIYVSWRAESPRRLLVEG